MSAQVFSGSSILAKELGISLQTVSRKRKQGLSDEQIRIDVRLREAIIRAGGKVRGRVTGTRLDPKLARVGVGKIIRDDKGKAAIKTVEREYVPKNGAVTRVGGRVSLVPVPVPVSVPVSVPVPVPFPSVPDRGHTPVLSESVWDDEASYTSASTSPDPNVPVDPRTGENFVQAQLRKEIALANEREVTVAIKRGQLVPISQVNAWFAGVIVRAREILTRIGPELRDQLASEMDPVKCEKLVTGEVDRALANLRTMDTIGTLSDSVN